MNSDKVKSFIDDRSYLFWYIPEDKKQEVSHELLVETIFNYGDLNDIRTLISVLGFEKLTEIYNGLKGRKKMNYYPEMLNFLSLIIGHYAQRNSR
ncbi:MAG: hypothetical protein ACM3PX_09985 [Omnitrophica WOR_2 bacterium]|jgi:hypothetical protein